MSKVTPIDFDEYDQDELDGLQEHEFAGLVPEMAPDEFDKLVDDIRRNGLNEPIVLFDGQILDGRHRHRAFRDHRDEWDREWEPDHFVEFEGSEEGARLRVTENVQRRHLTKPGLAVVACTIYLDDAKEEAEKRQAASSDGDDGEFDVTGESYDIAASKVSGVSGRSVRKIDEIRQDEQLQDVWEDLLKGRFKFISEAKRFARFAEDERQEIREKWEKQEVEDKDWKTAFEVVSDDSEEPSEQEKRFKRLRRGVKQVISSIEEDADELPTLKEKGERKRKEYKNFLLSMLEDLEERVA